jgi:precorrin-6Y C5,15-methyltransferase (decarboxylating)
VLSEIGKDAVEIFPDLSSIQVAFSRIKEPWDDALLISLHGGKRKKLKYAMSDIPLLLKEYEKIGILTDKTKNPVEIAKTLIQIPCQIFVCERLGLTDERIIEGTPVNIAGQQFLEPNVVIVINRWSGSLSV